MTNKITKNEYYTILTNLVSEYDSTETITIGEKSTTVEQVLAFIAREKELLANKATNRTLTESQKQNVEYTNDILNAMDVHVLYSISDIQSHVPSVAGLTNQRMSAILRNAVNDHTLVKVVEKRKSYWRLAVAGDYED